MDTASTNLVWDRLEAMVLEEQLEGEWNAETANERCKRYADLCHGLLTIRVRVAERLEYLRGEIRAERISYSELAELQSLSQFIDPGDVELLEWAGVPEFPS